MNPSTGQRASYLLTLLGLGAYLTLSISLLWVLHIPYAAPEGSFIFKLHPGTYLLLLALAVAVASQGNPVKVLPRQLAQMPWLSLYLAGMLYVFLYSLLRYGPSGSAFFIDTLIMPAVVVLLMARFSQAQLRGCYRLILWLLLLNGVIGLIEAALQRHLVPYTVANGVPLIEDKFRATALLGHPLDNALMTSILLLASLDLPLSSFKRIALSGLFVLALLAFGGRTSFVLSSAALLLYAGFATLRHLRSGKYSYLQILGSLIVAALLIPALASLLELSGLGTRIFQSLYLDDSAMVRFRILHVFDYLDGYDLLFGISPAEIQNLSLRLGLAKNMQAIENFWLLMLLQLGLFGFTVFVASLACGLYLLIRRVGAGGRWTLLVFLLTASTTNSLASKTCSLVVLFAVLYSLAGFRSIASPGLRSPGVCLPA